MAWSNDSQDSMGTPCDARTGIVRALQGNLQCFSYPTGPVRGPWPVWDPQGCRTTLLRTSKGIDTTWIDKNPGRALYLAVRGPYGPLVVPTRAVHGLFRISKHVRGPLAYNACIKTLRAPYGEAKSVRRRTGPVRAPWLDVTFLLKTAREQPVRGQGMWCHWGITNCILHIFNALRRRHNDRHFAYDTVKRIFLNESVRISFTISLKFIPKGLIKNIQSLVQIMEWCRQGYKPLSEPMIFRFRLPRHISVTRPQRFNPYNEVSLSNKMA